MIAPGLALGRADEVPHAGARLADADGVSLILSRCGDQVRAFRNRCTHADYPLQRADGRLIVQEGRYVVCAVHGASYRLDDGACAGGPCNGRALEAIAIIVRDGVIFTA